MMILYPKKSNAPGGTKVVCVAPEGKILKVTHISRWEKSGRALLANGTRIRSQGQIVGLRYNRGRRYGPPRYMVWTREVQRRHDELLERREIENLLASISGQCDNKRFPLETLREATPILRNLRSVLGLKINDPWY